MIQYIEATPTADEFNTLTDYVGWGCANREIVEKALKNTFYSFCAYDYNKIIGFGRLIGDTAIFLYIQDIQFPFHLHHQYFQIKNLIPALNQYME